MLDLSWIIHQKLDMIDIDRWIRRIYCNRSCRVLFLFWWIHQPSIWLLFWFSIYPLNNQGSRRRGMGVESRSGWSFKYGDFYGSFFFSNSVVMFSQPYFEDKWWNDPVIPTKYGGYGDINGIFTTSCEPKIHVFWGNQDLSIHRGWYMNGSEYLWRSTAKEVGWIR